MTFKELRKDAGLTVKDVSKKIGISTSTIYSYENSSRLPTVSILTQLARIYKVDFEEILTVYNNHKFAKDGGNIENELIKILSNVSKDEQSIILNNVVRILKSKKEEGIYE